MQIIRRPSELGSRKVCLAIGMFDGVHLGHQQVLRQTISDSRQHGALAVAITFNRHPNIIVAPTRVPPLIYSLPQKLRAISALGIDATLLIEFDRPFSEQPADEFIRGLERDFSSIYSVCVGANFTFGHKRSGTVELLQQLGRELKFIVHGLAAVQLDRKIVSSTAIRQFIRAGDLDAASQMLGRSYSIAAHVVRGDGLGRQLGVPTANIDVTGLALPPNGVYAAHTQWQTKTFPSVLNIGQRPTLQQPLPQLRFEVHLLDFDGNLYDQELEITFVQRLRDEQRFPSLEALKGQIHADINAAREVFR